MTAVPALIAIGSNIEPSRNIPLAIAELRQVVTLVKVSSTWETVPVGMEGPNFYNLAALIQTSLPPDVLNDQVLKGIEDRLGRVRTANKFISRTIDLDLVWYAGDTLEADIGRLAFYAVPLAEIYPDLIDPLSKKNLAELSREFLSQEYLIPHPELETRFSA